MRGEAWKKTRGRGWTLTGDAEATASALQLVNEYSSNE